VKSSSLAWGVVYNGSFSTASGVVDGKETAVSIAELVLFGAWGWLAPTLNVIILVIGIFLILLVLIQKGKGGGLAGAFGGVGGSSAFGTRAGDQFTRITLTVAVFWILLIMLMVKLVQPAPPPTDTSTMPSPVDESGRLHHPEAPFGSDTGHA
jgi:preprotein translocase subunit SecG